MSIIDRLREIKRIWNAEPREVRHTAVGWNPGEGWTPDCGKTASGTREYYRVVRPAPGKENKPNEQEH